MQLGFGALAWNIPADGSNISWCTGIPNAAFTLWATTSTGVFRIVRSWPTRGKSAKLFRLNKLALSRQISDPILFPVDMISITFPSVKAATLMWRTTGHSDIPTIFKKCTAQLGFSVSQKHLQGSETCCGYHPTPDLWKVCAVLSSLWFNLSLITKYWLCCVWRRETIQTGAWIQFAGAGPVWRRADAAFTSYRNVTTAYI